MHVIQATNPPTNSQRHKDIPRNLSNRRDIRPAFFGAGHDVVEDDLINLLLIEPACQLRGVANVDVVLKLQRLRDAAILYVKAGYKPVSQH